MYIVIQCVTSDGKSKIGNTRFSSDPVGYMLELNRLYPGCIHTWREAAPEEIRKRILREMSY